jgi:hypothetical protein
MGEIIPVKDEPGKFLSYKGPREGFTGFGSGFCPSLIRARLSFSQFVI